MTEQYQEPRPTALISMNLRQLVRAALIGAAVGLLTWAATLLLDNYIFKAMLCQGTAAMKCSASLNYASAGAAILAGGLGLFGLVKTQVFRALLVVIAAMISLWELQSVLSSWTWQGAVLVSVVLFALSYSLFAWLARIRTFILALVVMALLVAVVRFTLGV